MFIVIKGANTGLFHAKICSARHFKSLLKFLYHIKAHNVILNYVKISLSVPLPNEVMVTPRNMKILVTGASGQVGRAFRKVYRNYYSLRLMMHHRTVDASEGEELVSADITDLNSVLKVMQEVEAVVHLAADSRSIAPWDSILNVNIVGTYNIFEAARRLEVKKVVFGSSNRACGFAVTESDLVGPDAPTRPDSLYAVSKVFGEALGRYYSDKFGMSVICLRIGYCPNLEDPKDLFKRLLLGERPYITYSPKNLIAMWISNRDMAQLIHRSLETNLKFGIFYGTSENTPKIFDITAAKEELGYKPQDKAENYLK